MNRKIRKVAVIGAGVMGSSIAAHMANIGLDTYLLDIVPGKLDAGDIKKGLTTESPSFRNKLARAGLENTLKADPHAFYVPEDARLITTGNLEDHLRYLGQADWIIEAVVEDLAVKRQLLKRVESVRRPGAIVSTNTSGLSINKIAEGFSDELREHFLGIHFFNPPRYMKLAEVIPGTSTSKDVAMFMAEFCERRLGKGVVFGKDTPNFIANRIGMHNALAAIRTMMAEGYTIEEVDAITGTPLGRARSATFRTLDMVGLDTLLHIAKNLSESLTDAKEREEFRLPDFVTRMAEMKSLGEKSGRGFYKKVDSKGAPQIHTLDYTTMEYVPQRKASFPSLEMAAAAGDTGKRIKSLVYSEDRAGRFAWKVTKDLLLYSAAKIPEIADDIVSVDRAVKWGFNHELGPFELWDAIDVRKSVERMRKEGDQIPENVTRMLTQNRTSFYQKVDGKPCYYNFKSERYLEIPERLEIIMLPALKERQQVIKSNAGASLIDLGDGVACLEFHSPNNAIGSDIVEMINFGIDEVERNYEGLVIGNQGVNFCVGANLMLILMEAQNQNWDELDFMVRQFQGACLKIKRSEKPVVTAPFRMALGGGCEVCLASSRIRASAETYMGLVEVGVGLTPAGGGIKEMLLRNIDPLPASVPGVMPGGVQPDLIPYAMRAFETIAMARVSTSAKEAQKLGYMAPQDGITVNHDFLIHDAKQTVIALSKQGYTPRRRRDDIRVTGRPGKATMEAAVYNLKEGGFVSEHDARIAGKIAGVLTGGDLPQNSVVTEEYLLDLERESFLSLCGEAKSQERMSAMLKTGRPLRN